MAIKLKAKKRDNLSRSVTNQLRQDGYIPAVVYGKGKETQTISVDNVELLKTVRDEGRNAIISLDIENGSPVDVMLHDYQRDPIKDEVIHADFYIIDMAAEMDVSVSLRLEGEAMGSREGGILQQPLFELQVRATPDKIPEEIVVDISDLEIGDNLTIADLPKSDDYEFIEDPDMTVAVVLPPEEEEEPAEEVDLSAEPELVGAEDDEEEEAFDEEE